MDLLVHENEAQWKDKTTSRRPRVLIVEDDTTLEPFWMHIIDSIDERAEVKWMTTEEGAEYSVMKWLNRGKPYDLIISDIFLSGHKTGIELWRESMDLDIPFILTSVVSPKKLERMLGKNELVPPFIQKPLDVDECKAMIKAMLDTDQSEEVE